LIHFYKREVGQKNESFRIKSAYPSCYLQLPPENLQKKPQIIINFVDILKRKNLSPESKLGVFSTELKSKSHKINRICPASE